MKFCSLCDTKYLSKQCPKCGNKEYTSNPSSNENSSTFPKVIITIVIIVSIAIASIVSYLYIKEKEKNKILTAQNSTILQNNAELKSKLFKINNRQKILLKQVRELRGYKNAYILARDSNEPPKRYKSKPKKKTGNKNHKKMYIKNTQPRRETTYKQVNQPKAKKYNYRIPHYSSRIRIESDFTKRKENGLWKVTSGGIYGRSNSLIIGPFCNGKYNQKLKIDQTCYVQTLTLDKLYLKQNDVNEFYGYNNVRDEYMIECKYNQDNGYLHNCRVKLHQFVYD